MAIITLYASKINQMSGLLKTSKQKIVDFKDELQKFNKKIPKIYDSACDMYNQAAIVQASVKIQEELVDSIGRIHKKIDGFISDTIDIENNVVSLINTKKNEFYKKYFYLKSEFEKSIWEKVKHGFKKACEWCKEKITAFLDCCSDVISFLGKFVSTLGKCLWEGLKGFGNWLMIAIAGYLKWQWNGREVAVKWFSGFFNAIKSGSDGFKCWLKEGAKSNFSWLKEGTKSNFSWIGVGAADFCRAISKSIKIGKAVFTGSGHPTYTYDTNDPRSMAECLGIYYDEYLETMRYNYGFEKEISDLYLKLYLQIANDPANAYMNERDVTCEFNRMIASLCVKYSANRWHITTGNYSTADAFKMLMANYGFTKAQATDFITALNIQHGIDYDALEADLKGTSYSRFNGNLYNDVEAPNVENFKSTIKKLGAPVMKDFVHEALQFVEFNDSYDPVDIATGSTDRMISYSGDIISTRYDPQDFQSDIDANNVQVRLRSSDNNFIRVQQDYNNGVMNGDIKSRDEFKKNNGGIDNIRNNINSDLKSMMGNYMKEHEYDFYEKPINDFIEFLNQQE